jgi:DNA-binding SARP family transcriptional activator/tetratricopeptide (TPR) repeat protein
VTGVPELRVRLLGGLAVEGVPVLSLGSRKGRAVLRRLALAAGAYVPADELVVAAWPEGLPARAADQLAVLVSRLRGVVSSDRLEKHEAGYRLLCDWLDTSALRQHVARGEAALGAGDVPAALQEGRAAVALLTGPVLPEDDSDAALEERTAVERFAARARLLAADAALRSGSAWEAVELAARVREDDPYDEAALRLQLRALAATSRAAVAVTTYLETARLLRDELGTEPEAATEQVYLELLREQPPERPAERSRDLPGRAHELDQLATAWHAAESGTAGLVVVEGPAGIGKSSVLDALGQLLAGEAVVLRAVPDALGAELPLQPVLDALRAALQGRDALLGADRDLLAPLLGMTTAPTSTASSFAAVTTGSGRPRLLAALEALVHRLGEGRPVLLLLDDGHLADATTVQLLQRCTRAGAGHRLLVVVATRPDDGPAWHGRRLALGTLDRAAVAAVVGEERADELWDRSGGHPLFLHELARHDDGDLPASVLAAVAQRCAGTDDLAETLRAAAVLGAPDDVELLSAVRRLPRQDVLVQLERARRQGLLVADSRGFAFAHQMFREAFAAGVGPTRSTELHREAALELGGRRTADPRRVAHHAVLGGEPMLAAEALTAAAEHASRRYEHTEALSLLDRAVAHDDTVERRLARARVLLVLGRYGDAGSDAEEALSRGAGAAGLEVAALVAYYERDLDRALELADEAAQTATEPDLVAGCWCLAGRVLLTTGRLEEGLRRLEEAADLATGQIRAVAAVWMANLLAMRSDGTAAQRLAAGPTAVSARNDPSVEPYRVMALGRALTFLDRPYDALLAFEHLQEVVDRQQVLRFAGRAGNFRSWVLRNLGATDEAAELSAKAWDEVGEVRDLSHAEAHCHAALDLADAALRQGDLDGAVGWLERMTHAPTTPHVMRWRIDLRQQLLRGRWALQSGDAEAAGELAAAVLADAARLDMVRFSQQAQLLSARAALARGEKVDLDVLEATAEHLGTGAPLESWWLLAQLHHDTGEKRFRALAENRVEALLTGAGPWADRLKAAAARAL